MATDGLQDPAMGLQDPDGPDVTGGGDPLDDFDSPDRLDAMAALLGPVPEDQGANDAAGDDATGQSLDAADWEQMTDAEIEQYVKTLTPSEARKALLRQRDYTRKTQDVAARRRDVEAQQAMLTRQMTMQGQGGQEPPAPQQATPSPKAPAMKITDCVDEDGMLDLIKLEQYNQQLVETIEARLADQYVKPLGEKMSAREKAEAEQAQLAQIEALQKQHTAMVEAFPHYGKSEAVQRRVMEYMQETGLRDFRAAYTALYPDQYAEAVVRYKQAKAKGNQSAGQTQAPATPPNRQSGDQQRQRPEASEDLDEAGAQFLSQRMRIPLRD